MAGGLSGASLSDGGWVGWESERVAEKLLGEEASVGVEGKGSQSPRGRVEPHQLAAVLSSVLGRSSLSLRSPYWAQQRYQETLESLHGEDRYRYL